MANKLDGRMVSQLSARIRMQKKKRLEASEKRQYGYWITDKGDVLPVPYESHHKVAEDYIKTHMNAQFLASIEDEDTRNSPYVYTKAYSYVFSIGWIRVLNASYAFIAEIKAGSVARRAVHSFAKLAKEADAQGYTVSVNAGPGKSYYKEFTAQELSKANAFLLKEVNKTLLASDTPYGGWVTETGKVIIVDHQGHGRAAKAYINSNHAEHYKEYVSSALAIQEFLDYKTYALGELGWIRFRLDGKEMDVQCGLNAVSKITLSAFNDYLEDQFFETYYLDVDLPVGVEEYPAGIKPSYRGIPNVKYLMGIMRKCLKRNDMTAADYDEDAYGYWVTHEGKIEEVEPEEHGGAAHKYIVKHWYDEFMDFAVKQDSADPVAFCLSMGWVRIVNSRRAWQVEVNTNITKATYASVKMIISDAAPKPILFEVYDRNLGKSTVNKKFNADDDKGFLTALRAYVKKTNLAADDEDDAEDDFECWLTDKGETLLLGTELTTHAKRFHKYADKNSELKARYEKFVSENIENITGYMDRIYKFASLELGWIRIAGEPRNASFMVGTNAVSPLAYKALSRFVGQFDFENDLVIDFVRTDTERFATRYEDYNNTKKLLNRIRQNVKKNPVIEAALDRLTTHLKLTATLRPLAWWITSDGKVIDVDVEHRTTAAKYFPGVGEFKALSLALADGWLRLMSYGDAFSEHLAIQFDHDSVDIKSVNALTAFLKEMDFKVITTSVSLPNEQEKYKRYEPFDKKDIGKIVKTLRDNLRSTNKTEVELGADNEVLNTESFSVIERWLPEDKFSKRKMQLLELPGNNFRVEYYNEDGEVDGSNDFRFFETARQGLRELIQLNRDQNFVFYKENIMRDNRPLEAASIDALPPEEFNVVERWEIPATLALEIREQNGKYSIARFNYAVIAKRWNKSGESILGHSDLDRAKQRLEEEVKIYESVAKKKMKKVKTESVAKPEPVKPVESTGTKVYSGDFIKGLRLEYTTAGKNIYATVIHEVSNKAALKLDALAMSIETLANKLRTSELKNVAWKVAAYKVNTPEVRLLVNRVRAEILTLPDANDTPIPTEDTCSIHALSLTTGKPMEYVWAIVKPYFKKGGINIHDLTRVLALLGYKLDIVHELSGTERKKEKTWGFVQKALKDRKGSYLAYQLDHVIGIKDGLVKDTGKTGPRSPIMFVFEMTKIEAKHIAVTTRGEVKPIKSETKVTTVVKKPEIDPAEFKHPLVGQFVFGKNNNDTTIKGILMRGTDARGKTSGWAAILDEDGKPARAMLKGVKKMLTKPNKALQNAYTVMKPKEGKGV